MRRNQLGAAVACAMLAGGATSQTVVINAESEATILNDASLAIGHGSVFVGNNFQGSIRRGLVRFDLSSLPAGDITSATLTCLVTDQRGFNLFFDVHRVLTAWNEGPAIGGGGGGGQGVTASATDATWTQTGLGGAWASAGGDFVALSTDSSLTPNAGVPMTFDVTADVQLHAGDPPSNHGFILISQTEPTTGNVIGISTDDDGFPAITLTVEVSPTSDCTADTNGDGMLTPSDFSAWVQAFNAQGPACDQNGDDLCTPQDFSAWIQNFNAGCG